MIGLLDSGPLGLVSQSVRHGPAFQTNVWMRRLLDAGIRVAVPEVADYEVRRELIRAGKTEGILHLDRLGQQLLYLPISTPVMRLAAQYWAQARAQGRPTAHPHALDGDVILTAQAAFIAEVENDAAVIATTNVDHLAQFADARLWQDIQP